jgi:transposase
MTWLRAAILITKECLDAIKNAMECWTPQRYNRGVFAGFRPGWRRISAIIANRQHFNRRRGGSVSRCSMVKWRVMWNQRGPAHHAHRRSPFSSKTFSGAPNAADQEKVYRAYCCRRKIWHTDGKWPETREVLRNFITLLIFPDLNAACTKNAKTGINLILMLMFRFWYKELAANG